jgi:hypothetical protein
MMKVFMGLHYNPGKMLCGGGAAAPGKIDI